MCLESKAAMRYCKLKPNVNGTPVNIAYVEMWMRLYGNDVLQ